MWSPLLPHPELSAFALLLCMSTTRLLSECQMLYDWDYDEAANTNSGFQVRSYTDVPFENGADNRLVFNYDYEDEMTLMQPERRRGLGEGLDRLSPEEAWLLRERLKGLYAMLKKHPALMDRRLQVGSKKPQIPTHHRQHFYDKRSFSHLSSTPVCPSRTEWRLLRVARDINDTEVEVFQPSDGSDGHQWFYTTTCNDDHPDLTMADCPRCCRGINKHRYHSHCMTKKSFVMALVRKPSDQQYDWNWIQVDSSCTCSISPA